jgi:hypothetical protein
VAAARSPAFALEGDARLIVMKSAFSNWVLFAVCGFALICGLDSRALSVQHLVRPGDDWQSLGPRLRPGDDIILMPGLHRPATFDQITGSAKRPITIRGADPANPSTIEAGREGLRIKSGSNLVIRNLVITGASVCGINLETAEDAGAGNVRIESVRITKTGPRGLRHAISLRNLHNVQIHDCLIEGWGGAAVEIMTCSEVNIDGCTFKGLADHAQQFGVRVRALSKLVEMNDCRFDQAGAIALCVGAASSIKDLPQSALESAKNGTLAEATSVRVQRCSIIGSQCGVAFINASECAVRNSTFLRQKRCVFALGAEQSDPRFSPGARNAFARNVIVWQPGDLHLLAETGPQIDQTKFTLDANLWWSTQTAEDRAKLGVLPGKEIQPQVFDVDPALDDFHRVTAAAADGFGP